MNQRKALLGAFILAILFLLITRVKAVKDSRDEAVYEGAIRGYSPTFCKGDGSKCVVFVQIAGHDPSPAFISHFNGTSIEVRNGSQAEERPKGRLPIPTKDLYSGEIGYFFRFHRIVYLSPTSCMVYLEDGTDLLVPRQRNGAFCDLKLRHGVWKLSTIWDF